MNFDPNTGLVLEGGGFRGMFTAGVLDVFFTEELFFDYIIAVSAGAAYGVSYVSRQLERNLEVNKYVADPRYCGFKNLLKTGNFFNWDFVYKEIPTMLIPFDYQAFSSSTSRMLITLTNCATGNAEYKELAGDTPEAFRDLLTATSSIPLISKIKIVDNQAYLDGGVADAIPFQKAFNDGCKRLIVILTREAGYRKKPTKSGFLLKLFYKKYPKLVRKMRERSEIYNNSLDEISELEKAGKIFVIRPSEPIAVARLENNPETLKKVYLSAKQRMTELLPEFYDWLKTDLEGNKI